MHFSVLLSIYHKEKVEYFHKAMESIWDKQTLRPNEIILVQDGVLTAKLYEAIHLWEERLTATLKIIALEENKGLGDALNIGLQHCTYELVARMDTDDIAAPDRFEKQLKIFSHSSIDICSGWVSEFEKDENIILSYRKLPELHQELLAFSKKRNPMNHPAVMYKKSVVLQAGGYQKMMLFEDYYLWSRMFIAGATFYNIQEVLVKMRAGNAQLKRRTGFQYAKKEILFQKKLFDMDFINIYELLRNVSIRFTTRVVPKPIVKYIYQTFRA